MLEDQQPQFSMWFANDGGPLIILPRELLEYWEGSDRPSAGRIIETTVDEFLDEFAGTDYARACAAGGLVSVIPVGPGHGIVLGAEDHAYGVQWLRLPEAAGIMVVIPTYSEEDTDQLLVDELRRTPEDGWHLIFPSLRTTTGDLLLLHAANNGQKVTEPQGDRYAVGGETISCRIEPGTYAVDERTLLLRTIPDDSEFVVCRFRAAQD